MKRFLIFLLIICAYTSALGQAKLYLRADSVIIEKKGGYAELVLRNKTKDTLGILVNTGGGVTAFKRSHVINDSSFVVGNDTLTLAGGSGGLDINEVNNAIEDALADLPINFDSVLFINDGSIGAPWSIDTTTWIETKYHSQYLIDSLAEIIDAITVSASGVLTRVFNTDTSDNAEPLVHIINDSTYVVKRLIAGTNVTFTVTGDDITINSTGGDGCEEINTISITASTVADVTISAEGMIEYVNVEPTDDLTDFRVGTLSDEELYFPQTPVLVANGITTLAVDGYVATSTAVYFRGFITPTNIQIVFKLIHE